MCPDTKAIFDHGDRLLCVGVLPFSFIPDCGPLRMLDVSLPPLSPLTLTWPDRARQAAVALAKGVPEFSPGPLIGTGASSHQFIEADNLDALKWLSSREGQERPRLILIDPPYNTDRKFFYADQHGSRTTTAAERRAAWLADLWPRFVLAWNWLAEDGVMAVHIDEHEAHYLQVLMTEIFGPSNNLGVIVWDKCNPKGDAGGISVQHESILVFAKNLSVLKASRKFRIAKPGAQAFLDKAASVMRQVGKIKVPADLKKVIEKYGLEVDLKCHRAIFTIDDARAEFKAWTKLQSVPAGLRAYDELDDHGQVYRTVSMAWPNKKTAPDEYFHPLIHPVLGVPCPVPDRGWRNPPPTMARLLSQGAIAFGVDASKQPERKYFLKNHMTENLRSIVRYGGSDDALLKHLGVAFDTPKPVGLTEQLIEAFLGKSGGLVVDFYAGSGTVGHAALRLANRGLPVRSILVQRPEVLADTPEQRAGFRFCQKNGLDPVISSLTRERLRRALEAEQLSGSFTVWGALPAP